MGYQPIKKLSAEEARKLAVENTEVNDKLLNYVYQRIHSRVKRGKFFVNIFFDLESGEIQELRKNGYSVEPNFLSFRISW